MSEPSPFYVPVAVDAAAERDYSAAHPEETASLPRDQVWVRSMVAEDLDPIVRIDGALSGRDRRAYLSRKLDEALNESAIRVSLTAEADGNVVGFLMARVDFGDYGRAETTAVLDTIGVNPRFARRGIGAALLSQLRLNLSMLDVETLETQAARENFDLLAFLYRHGARPSQRLVFQKTLD